MADDYDDDPATAILIEMLETDLATNFDGDDTTDADAEDNGAA